MQKKLKGFKTKNSTYVFFEDNTVWNEKLGKQAVKGAYVIQDEQHVANLMYVGCMNEKTLKNMIISGKIRKSDLRSDQEIAMASAHRILLDLDAGQVVTSCYQEPIFDM